MQNEFCSGGKIDNDDEYCNPKAIWMGSPCGDICEGSKVGFGCSAVCQSTRPSGRPFQFNSSFRFHAGGIPMKPGHAGTITHDFERHAATSLPAVQLNHRWYVVALSRAVPTFASGIPVTIFINDIRKALEMREQSFLEFPASENPESGYHTRFGFALFGAFPEPSVASTAWRH